MLNQAQSNLVMQLLEYGLGLVWLSMIVGFIAFIFSEVKVNKKLYKISIRTAYAIMGLAFIDVIWAGYALSLGF
jgi:hypothetical protein